MLPRLSGATRIHLIVGDPIDQAKSPAGLTRVFAERGVDAACIPMQVPAPDFDAFLAAAKRVQNIDGIVITVPHKFSATRHCETLSARAHKLAAVNVMRRETDGRWSGDMTDGIALVAALRARGFEPKGRRALVVGAGGAGSAVALALAEAGASLAISEIDPARRDGLRKRLADVAVGSGDPRGFDVEIGWTDICLLIDGDVGVEDGFVLLLVTQGREDRSFDLHAAVDERDGECAVQLNCIALDQVLNQVVND